MLSVCNWVGVYVFENRNKLAKVFCKDGLLFPRQRPKRIRKILPTLADGAHPLQHVRPAQDRKVEAYRLVGIRDPSTWSTHALVSYRLLTTE